MVAYFILCIITRTYQHYDIVAFLMLCMAMKYESLV